MKFVLKKLPRFLRETSAATMVEYGIMIAVIAAVAILVISNIGTQTNLAFSKVNTQLANATQ
jgi:pilus assembly protein Flp/PilA